MATKGLFEQFQKQMKEKGLDLNKRDTSEKEKSDLLRALEEHIETRQRGPQTHTDHGSFTRHSSHAAAHEKEKKEKEQESNEGNNNCVSTP